MCGGHAFRPPCKKLQRECQGGMSLDTAQKRALAQLRSGCHPDSRPPYYIGNPRPLFEYVRRLDPHPMLPRSKAGPASQPPTIRARDLTPVPVPIDFLAAYSRPKAPRIRSPSPCPYAQSSGNSSPPLGGPASVELTQEIVDGFFSQDVASSPPVGGPAIGIPTQDGGFPLSPPLGGPAVAFLQLPQDIEQGDISHSPLPSILRFDHCTPNPSAPSPCTQNSVPQACISCNVLFTPRGVKTVTGNAMLVWNRRSFLLRMCMLGLVFLCMMCRRLHLTLGRGFPLGNPRPKMSVQPSARPMTLSLFFYHLHLNFLVAGAGLHSDP